MLGNLTKTVKLLVICTGVLILLVLIALGLLVAQWLIPAGIVLFFAVILFQDTSKD